VVDPLWELIWEEMIVVDEGHWSSYKELLQVLMLIQGTCSVLFAEVKWKGGRLWMLPDSISIARYETVHKKLVDLVGLMRSYASMREAFIHQHAPQMSTLQGSGTGGGSNVKET
jgi:hypothetical protein